MAKFEEAANRLFRGTFVCKNCKTKIKADPTKINQGKVKCRRCGRKSFRPLRKLAKTSAA